MATSSTAEELLTVRDLQALLGISRSAAFRVAGKLPRYKLPGVGLRVKRGDVETFLEQHRTEPTAPATARERPGTSTAWLANEDDEEVLPGLTRGELRRKAGY